jgi:hypothetical protein
MQNLDDKLFGLAMCCTGKKFLFLGPDFSPGLYGVAVWAGLQPCHQGTFLIISVLGAPLSVFGGTELWSAAACCRFPPRELARGNFNGDRNFPPASWLAKKRQQAAALQSSAPNGRRKAFFRNLRSPASRWQYQINSYYIV